ncbi:ras family small GTPase [Pelomyxa schiedti]|nr:ras family small GTPase [Pelomyxa schiedti]
MPESVFGVPLSRSVPPGCSMPPPIEQLLSVLTCFTPSDPSLFELPMTHPKVSNLKSKFDANVPLPFDEEDNPQVLAALLVLFLHQLPHPLIPPRMFTTAMRVGSVCDTLTRLRLLRAFMAKLPLLGRALTLQLLVLLHATRINEMRLAALFAPYLMRQGQHQNLEGGGAADYGVVCLVSEMISQADYISLNKQEPDNLPKTTTATNEFVLLATAICDFSANGTPGVLSFNAGDSVQLIDAHPNSWLEACIHGVLGFIPEAYVEIVPVIPTNKQASSTPPNAAQKRGVSSARSVWVPSQHPQQSQQSQLQNTQPAQQPTTQIQHQEPTPPDFGNSQTVTRTLSSRSYSTPIMQTSHLPSSLSTSEESSSPTDSSGWTAARLHAITEADNPSRTYRSTSNGNSTQSSLSITLTRTTSTTFSTQSPTTTTCTTTVTPFNTAPEALPPPPSTPSLGLPNRPAYTAPSPQLSKTYSDINPEEGWDEIHVVVIGTGGVGKSCFTVRFVQNDFLEEYDPTLEDSYRKQFSVDDRVCFLKILDTAGQEEYSSLRDQYMRLGQGFIIMCSVTSKDSLIAVPTLAQAMLKCKDADVMPPAVLVANKCDLQAEVTAQEVQDVAASFNIPMYISSAKLHKNVDEVFIALVRQVRAVEATHTKSKRSVCCLL